MSGSNPRRLTASTLGWNRMLSWRSAPFVAQPIGMPLRSTARDHFGPDLARSQGFFPVPSPPEGALCPLPSTETSDRSNPITRS